MSSITINNDFTPLLESETQEDNMNATQQTTSQTPTAPPKNQVFRTCPRFICLDKMLPSILVSLFHFGFLNWSYFP